MTLIEQAVRIEYPLDIVKAAGTPFIRPANTGDSTVYTEGYYYENADGDRFYFDTYAEAAEDLAIEIGMTKEEAAEIIERNP